MIVVPDGDSWMVFTQEAHAHLAGNLAARLAGGADWERSALVTAARIHDNGWREADVAPTIDGDGHPHTFYRIPPEVYLAVWRRGIARAAAVDPLVGLLVGLHGARFFGMNPDPGVQRLLREERARQDRVLADLGLSTSWEALPAPLQAASDWIAFVDQLSLMVCGALADTTNREVAGTEYRITRGTGRLTVAPWPFADAGEEVAIDGRRLPAHPYSEAKALHMALAAAPHHTRTVMVTPPP